MNLRSIPPILCTLLLLSLTVACDKGDKGATDGGGTGAAADAAVISESCSFETCSGCCDGNTCIEDTDEANCGQPGMACQSCSGTDVCAAGTCTPIANDCSDCGGCCFEGQVCLEGNTKAACGSDGDSCMGCPAGEGCVSGSCEAINCDASNCDGCCTANGECIANEQQATSACGKNGGACEVCPSDALSCTLGTCVLDQPCLDFCDEGCCTPSGQCIPFAEQDPNTCGAAETCSACDTDLSCLGGSCTADPVWTVIVKSAIIDATDAEGGDWDQGLFANPLPDPYVMGSLSEDLLLDWVTATIDDTLTPNWNETEGSYLQSELIAQGLNISVRDADGFGAFERIGDCLMAVSLAELNAGGKTKSSCGSSTQLVFEFVMQ